MKAIIPTAGVGSRLRPFTHTIPKVLLQVADKPILGHILDKLVENRVTSVTFVVGYLGDRIEEYVRREYDQLEVHFVQQPEARGLGHAIHLTSDLHRSNGDEPVLIILGDTIIDADLSLLHDAETDLIGVCAVEDPRRFGVVELDGDQITKMVEKPEKPKTNLAIVGVYYLQQPALLFDSLDENIERGVLTKGEVQLTDALQLMLEKGVPMSPFMVQGWHDCGKPDTLLATNTALLRQRFPDASKEITARYPTVRVRPPVYVAPSAQVSDSIIGPNVSIGENVRLTGSIVSNSIVNEDAQVEDIILAGSIIGNGAVAKQAPMRLYVGDRSEVVLG